jgi:hypothetical protein
MISKSRNGCLTSTLVSALFCWALLSVQGRPQGTTGTITGTVSDSGGAVVPGAAVTVTNEQTHLALRSLSNESGDFVVPGLEPGDYDVSLVKQGFQTYTESRVMVKPAQVSTINAVLKVGELTTAIQVEASAARVQISTPEVSSEVTERQIATLPLNGRNLQTLGVLMPGVTNLAPDTAAQTGGFLTSNTMSVNGMGIAGSMYYLDGVFNVNSGSFNKLDITPPPDTVEEVRLLQNNYGAQYTLFQPSVMLLVTKSGTSSYHGSAFEYLRNDAFDARNFFTPKVPALKQNIFGYTIGGPFTIPGHFNTKKDKVFFFWSQQWTVQHIASILTGRDATQAERNGTFSTKIINPTTGQPFPQDGSGNYQIPPGMLNAQSLLFLNAMAPLPNNPAGGFNNYLNTTPTINNTRDDEIKGDYIFGPRLRLMAEYMDELQTNLSSSQSFGLTTIYSTVKQPITAPDQLAQIRLTQVFSPSLVNTTSINMCNYDVNFQVTGLVYKNQLPGFSSTLPFNGYLSDKLPEVDFSGGWPNIGVSRILPADHSAQLENTLSDDASWLRGKHYLEFGFEQVYGTDRQLAFAATAGQWLFNGQFTGNPMADYLIGKAATFTQGSSDVRSYQHWTTTSGYVQDQWKAKRRLTLTLGFRYAYSPQPSFQKGISNFIPSRFNPAKAPIVNPDGTFTTGPNYDPLNGLVFGGVTPGFPANYTTLHRNFYNPSFGFAYDVFGDGKTSLRGGFGITHANIFQNACNTQCPLNYPLTTTLTLLSAPFPSPVGAVAKPATVPTLRTQDQNLNTGRTGNFSLSLQHEFQGGWFVSLAGAGDAIVHGVFDANENQPLPFGGFDFNPIINTGTVSPYAYGAPFPGYGALPEVISPIRGTWYGLMFNARHPVGHNFFASVAYTWQKGLTVSRGQSITSSYSGTQNYYNINSSRGPANVIPSQVFSFSAIWTLPWFAQASGLKGAFLKNWQYSDITSIQGGFPLDPGLATAHPGLATRPNRIANNITGPKTRQQWFNTSAFAAPSPGFFGNAGTGIITGPGTIDFDMALYKDFKFGETRKIQFRGEFFNVFNHTNFNGVVTSFGAGNFGQVTSAKDPREIELVLRLEF